MASSFLRRLAAVAYRTHINWPVDMTIIFGTPPSCEPTQSWAGLNYLHDVVNFALKPAKGVAIWQLKHEVDCALNAHSRSRNMKYGWKIALGASLLLVIGFAAGVLGAVSALLAFSVALFLQWADKLGFAGARRKLAPDRFSIAVLKAGNWQQLTIVLEDHEKFERALTCAVMSIALLLILPTYLVLCVALVVAGWFAFQVHRSQSAGQSGLTHPEPEL
jgi:hypothetical protein